MGRVPTCGWTIVTLCLASSCSNGTWRLVLGALQNIPLRTPQHSCPLKILIDQFIRNKRPTLYIYSTSFHQVLAVLSFEKLKQLLSRFKIFKKSQDHLLTRFANISQKVLKKERPKKRFPGKYFPESAFLMCWSTSHGWASKGALVGWSFQARRIFSSK